MDKFLIKGGKSLHGTVSVSGAKNSALPAMAAALLTSHNVTVRNIPKVRDLITMSKLLAFMGASVSVTEIPASDYTISAPIFSSAARCRSIGRAPMAQPPGRETRATPRRAMSGPSVRMEARIVFTSS